MIACLSLLFLLQSPTVTFAWLSDTHVGSVTGEEDLRASVRDINANPALQFVIVSGDVTEFGSDEQLRTAKRLLDSIHIPVHIIPGNHDTKWSESGCMTFPRLWGSDRFVFDAGPFRFIGMHEGPRLRMADGHFAPEDLRWLDSVLAAMPAAHKPLIFVTHYPLDSSITNWFAVTTRLKRYNTKMALVGHGHANVIEDFEGIPGLMGRSNLRAGHPSAGFTVMSISGDSVVAEEHNDGIGPDRVWYRGKIRPDIPYDTSLAYPRPDFSVNARYPRVSTRWHWTGPSTIVAPPGEGDSSIIVGDASGAVTALNIRTGLPLWSYHSRGPVCDRPLVVDHRVVFGSADGGVYCLSISTGRFLWRTPTRAAVLGVPAAYHDTIVIGGSDRVFRALNLSDGSVLWTSDSLHGFVETRPLVADGRVVFGAWDEKLHALDARTGRTLWVWEGGRPGILYSPAACWPVESRGKVFIVAPDRVMTAIDASTGRTLWRSARFQVRESIGRSLDGSRIYVRTMRDSIVAIDANADTCRSVWVTNCGFGYDINSAMLVERDGTVYYGTKNGLVLALRGDSGKILWRHRAGISAINTICPLSSTDCVLTDFDGNVEYLSTEDTWKTTK